jgi:hypothetical protein
MANRSSRRTALMAACVALVTPAGPVHAELQANDVYLTVSHTSLKLCSKTVKLCQKKVETESSCVPEG